MRTYPLTILLIILVSSSGFAQSFKFADEHPFKLSDNQGRIEIALDQTVLQRGEQYAVNYKFTNTNSSYPIYNWQFMRLIPLPGQLAIYDADKKYIGDLIAFECCSQSSARLADWTYLYGGSYVGASLGFHAGYVPMTKYGSTSNLLPPGQYYIQLIMYKAFVSERSSLTEEVLKDFRQNFDRSELCRSNEIKSRRRAGWPKSLTRTPHGWDIEVYRWKWLRELCSAYTLRCRS